MTIAFKNTVVHCCEGYDIVYSFFKTNMIYIYVLYLLLLFTKHKIAPIGRLLFFIYNPITDEQLYYLIFNFQHAHFYPTFTSLFLTF